VPFSTWRAFATSGRAAQYANGKFWNWSYSYTDRPVLNLVQYDLFGNPLRTITPTTLNGRTDFAAATSPDNRLHSFLAQTGRFVTFTENSTQPITDTLVPGTSDVGPLSAANPVIATASNTSGMLAITNALFEGSGGEYSDTIVVRAFNPSTGLFTGGLIQVTQGSMPELVALTDGRYALIARVGPPTVFFLDDAGAVVAFQTISDRAAPRLAALSDGGFALVGRQGDGTVAVNVYTAQEVLEATRALGVSTSDYSLATLPGSGFAVSLGTSDTLIFYDNSGVEARRETLPAGLGGHEFAPFADGRIAIDGVIYDPRPDFNGLTDYGGVTYQIGGGGDDFIIARPDADEVHGGPGNDIIIDDPNTKGLITGDEGDDLIIIDGYINPDSRTERVTGGPGNDTLAIIFPPSTAAYALYVIYRFDGGYLDTGFYSTTGNVGFENLSMSNDTPPGVFASIYGDNGPNIITTGGGGDYLVGGGDDILDGGAGRDQMEGGTGDDVYIVDNPGDTVVEKPDEGFDTVRTSLANYALPANVERLEYTGTGPAQLTGTAGNDVLVGGSGDDRLQAQDGGNDTLDGGDGNDAFFFGAAFDANDSVDGGAGTNDQIGLQGNYGALTLGANSTRNVEVLALLRGVTGDLASYNITLADDLVGAGQTFTLFGLATETGFTLNATAETNGNVNVFGGSGADTISTGAGNDRIFGGGGADVLNGGAGADTFVYDAVSQSTGINYDRIIGFRFGEDKFDFGFAIEGLDFTVANRSLSRASFDADLGAAIGAAQLTPRNAVLFQPSAGDLAGQTFLVVDANGIAGYQSGGDYVVQLVQPTQMFSAGSNGLGAFIVDPPARGDLALDNADGIQLIAPPASLVHETFI